MRDNQEEQDKGPKQRNTFWDLSIDNYDTTITLEQWRRNRKAAEDANNSTE